MRFNQHCFPLLSLLVCFNSFANGIHKSDNLLAVTPKICIVEQVGDSCEVRLTVQWQSLLPLSHCLYQNEQENVCWYNQKQVSQAFIFEINQNQFFSLRDHKNQVLAAQQVQLNTHVPKKYRRRLRADWSLF